MLLQRKHELALPTKALVVPVLLCGNEILDLTEVGVQGVVYHGPCLGLEHTTPSQGTVLSHKQSSISSLLFDCTLGFRIHVHATKMRRWRV